MEIRPVFSQKDTKKLDLLSSPNLWFLLVVNRLATGQRLSVAACFDRADLILFLCGTRLTENSIESMRLLNVGEGSGRWVKLYQPHYSRLSMYKNNKISHKVLWNKRYLHLILTRPLWGFLMSEEARIKLATELSLYFLFY